MLDAFRPVKKKLLRRIDGKRMTGTNGTRPRDWKTIRVRQFRRKFSKYLRLTQACEHCKNPVDERMQTCPWCGMNPMAIAGDTEFPAQCPRCDKGVKLDWSYCAWCRGPKIGPLSRRSFTDRRYTAKCASSGCGRPLMPFMRYCPWCRAKVKRRWKMGKEAKPCPKCEQPTAPQFWSWCAWCGTSVGDT
jgi:hypothetical protein